jgi:hypothetical protein
MDKNHGNPLTRRELSKQSSELGFVPLIVGVGSSKERWFLPHSRPALTHSEQIADRIIQATNFAPVFPRVSQGFSRGLPPLLPAKPRNQGAVKSRFGLRDKPVEFGFIVAGLHWRRFRCTTN